MPHLIRIIYTKTRLLIYFGTSLLPLWRNLGLWHQGQEFKFPNLKVHDSWSNGKKKKKNNPWFLIFEMVLSYSLAFSSWKEHLLDNQN